METISNPDGQTRIDHDLEHSPPNFSNGIRCQHCHRAFITKELLFSHLKEHDQESLFQCFICSSIFDSASQLSTHLESHNLLRAFKCGFCDVGFHENSSLLDHLNLFHNGLPVLYKCRVCSLSFQVLHLLKEHLMLNHHSKKDLQVKKYETCQQPTDFSKHDESQRLNNGKLSLNHLNLHHAKEGNYSIQKNKNKKELPDGDNRDGVKSESQEKAYCEICNRNFSERAALTLHTKICHASCTESHSVMNSQKKVIKKSFKSNAEKLPFEIVQKLKMDKKLNSSYVRIQCEPINRFSRKKPSIKHQDRLPYKCNLCSREFHSLKKLASHKSVHNLEGSYSIHCSHCNNYFNNKSLLEAHLSDMHCCGFNCDQCSESFSLESTLLRHIGSKHAQRKNGTFTCSVCCKSFDSSATFGRHSGTHAISQPYQCKACGSNYTLFEILLVHLRGVHGLGKEVKVDNSMVLPKSEMAHLEGTVLKIHWRANRDEEDNDGKCTEFGMSDDDEDDFSNESEIKKQVEVKEEQNIQPSGLHGDQWSHPQHSQMLEEGRENRRTSLGTKFVKPDSYFCYLCNKIFDKWAKYIQHRARHEIDGMYVIHCEQCLAAFENLDSLEDHFKTTDCQMHNCKICTKSFALETFLLSHESKDHSDKSTGLHLCIQCDKSYERSSDLARHVSTHTKSRPYQCKKCEATFAVSDTLFAHLRSMHRIGRFETTARNTNVQNKKRRSERKDQLEKEDPCFKGKNKKELCISNKRVQNKRRSRCETPDLLQYQCVPCQQIFSRLSQLIIHSKHCMNKTTNGAESKTVLMKPTQHKLMTSFTEKKHRSKFYSPHEAELGQGELIEIKNKNHFDCNLCGGRLFDGDSFKRHRKDHFIEGKYSVLCFCCKKGFDNLSTLATHAQEKNCSKYKCNVCEQIFPLQVGLLCHQADRHPQQNLDGDFLCRECMEIFKSHQKYIDHATKHAKEKSFQCNLCDSCFITEFSVEFHLKSKHSCTSTSEEKSSRSHTCTICKTKFLRKDAFQAHNEFHIRKLFSVDGEGLKKDENPTDAAVADLPYSCCVCAIGFCRENDLKRHKKLHQGSFSKKVCPVCNKVVKRSCDLRPHMNSHTKPYLCPSCGKAFALCSQLSDHEKAYHSTVNPFQCEYCQKYYTSKTTLKQHIRIHTGDKRYECKHCHKKFTNSTYLESHKGMHMEEKPFKCNLCPYECRHATGLRRHMNMHYGVKKYGCPICLKRFGQIQQMKAHLTIHTGEKNFECEFCYRRFARSCYLKVHLRTHTKEKPFACSFCSQNFAVRSNLNLHIY